MKRISFVVLVAFCLFLNAELFAKTLSGQINDLIGKANQKKVTFGISIAKQESGENIFSYNANRPLTPASNMKVITTATALKYLGSDYKYQTVIALSSKTLIIIGGGDPLLGDAENNSKYNLPADWPINDIVEILKQKNINQIENIVINTSIFDDNRVHPNWPKDQLNKWYACEVCGLNFNSNCIDITATVEKSGIALSLSPQTSFLTIVNQAKATSKGSDTIGAYRNSKENHIILKGKVNKVAGPFKVAIERPASFFGFMLAERLQRAGIAVGGSIIEGPVPADSNAVEILKTYTTPISDVVERCNRDSLGLAAECLLKTISANTKSDKQLGSWQNGREIVNNYLIGLGIDKAQFVIDDASGLSRNNRLSANALVAVLMDVSKNPQYFELFKKTLSVGGVSGTASKWFKDEKYKGKLLVKTGYIDGVRSYSGYCFAKSGVFVYSIITNNSNGHSREVMNDILETLVEY